MKSLVVGIDVGNTVGIAILDLKGHVLHLWSKRNAKNGEIVREILKFGKPVILATDVNPLPKRVEKLASSLGCVVFYPERSLSLKEKSKLLDRVKLKIKNVHQRDAMTSALRAFKRYRPLFLRAEDELKKIDREDLLDDVIRRVLEKRGETIVDAIRKLKHEKKKTV